MIPNQSFDTQVADRSLPLQTSDPQALFQSSVKTLTHPSYLINSNRRRAKIWKAPSQKMIMSLPKGQLGNKNRAALNQYKWHHPLIEYLPCDLINHKTILDIGCAEGYLDHQIALRFLPKSVKGIDIDGGLISRAEKWRQVELNKQRAAETYKQFKLAAKVATHKQQTNNELEHIFREITELPECFLVQLDESLGNNQTRRQSKTKKYIMEPVQSRELIPRIGEMEVQIEKMYPHNLSFEVENVFNLSKQGYYDTILSVGVVKYLHITFGDQIIVPYFTKIYSLLKPGGALILEYQKWESYKSDRNESSINRIAVSTIKLRPAKFPDILENMGFVEDKTQSQLNKKWSEQQHKRVLKIYRRSQGRLS